MSDHSDLLNTSLDRDNPTVEIHHELFVSEDENSQTLPETIKNDITSDYSEGLNQEKEVSYEPNNLPATVIVHGHQNENVTDKSLTNNSYDAGSFIDVNFQDFSMIQTSLDLPANSHIDFNQSKGQDSLNNETNGSINSYEGFLYGEFNPHDINDDYFVIKQTNPMKYSLNDQFVDRFGKVKERAEIEKESPRESSLLQELCDLRADSEDVAMYMAGIDNVASLDEMQSVSTKYELDTPISFKSAGLESPLSVKSPRSEKRDINISSTTWTDKKVKDIIKGKIPGGISRIFSQDISGWTGLHRVCYNGSLDLAIQILNQCSSLYVDIKAGNGKTALHCASRNGKLDVVLELLNRGAKVNERDNNDETPLLAACEGNHLDIVKLLLSRNADCNISDKKNGRYPIHEACWHDRVTIVRELFKNDADIESINRYHETPIFCALYKRSNIYLLKELIGRGANINAKDNKGQSLLHRACLGNHVDIIKVLLFHQADINTTDILSNTPLHAACAYCPIDIVVQLLQRGADFEVLNKALKTPLYKACKRGRINVVLELLNQGAKYYDYTIEGVSIPSFLLTYIDRSGNTVLHQACLLRYTYLMDRILDLNGDPYSAEKIAFPYSHHDAEGLLPLDLALRCHSYDVLRLAIATVPGLSATDISRLCEYADADIYCRINSCDIRAIANLYSQEIQYISHIHLLGDSFAGKSTAMKTLEIKFEENILKTMFPTWFESPIVSIDPEERTKGVIIKKYDINNRRRVFYDYGGNNQYQVLASTFLKYPCSIYVIVLSVWNFQTKCRYDIQTIRERYKYWLQNLNSIHPCDGNKLKCITIINGFNKLSLAKRSFSGQLFKENIIQELKQIQNYFLSKIKVSTSLSDRNISIIDFEFIDEPIFINLSNPDRIRQNFQLFLKAEESMKPFTCNLPKLIPAIHLFKDKSDFLSSYSAISYDSASKKQVVNYLQRQSHFNDFIEQFIAKKSPQDSEKVHTEVKDAIVSMSLAYAQRMGEICLLNSVLTEESWIVYDPSWWYHDICGNLIYNLERLQYERQAMNDAIASLSNITKSNTETNDQSLIIHRDISSSPPKAIKLRELNNAVMNSINSNLVSAAMSISTKNTLSAYVLDSLQDLGEVLIVPSNESTDSDSWVITDVSWLKARITNQSETNQLAINHSKKNPVTAINQLTQLEIYCLIGQLGSISAIEFLHTEKSQFDINESKEAMNRLLQGLCSLGLCLPVKSMRLDDPETMFQCPYFIDYKINEKASSTSKRLQIFPPLRQGSISGNRIVIHRFKLPYISHQTLTHGYFHMFLMKIVHGIGWSQDISLYSNAMIITKIVSSSNGNETIQIFIQKQTKQVTIEHTETFQEVNASSITSQDVAVVDQPSTMIPLHEIGIDSTISGGDNQIAIELEAMNPLEKSIVSLNDDPMPTNRSITALVDMKSFQISNKLEKMKSKMEHAMEESIVVNISCTRSHTTIPSTAWKYFTIIRNILLYEMVNYSDLVFDDYGIHPFTDDEMIINHIDDIDMKLAPYEYGINANLDTIVEPRYDRGTLSYQSTKSSGHLATQRLGQPSGYQPGQAMGLSSEKYSKEGHSVAINSSKHSDETLKDNSQKKLVHFDMSTGGAGTRGLFGSMSGAVNGAGSSKTSSSKDKTNQSMDSINRIESSNKSTDSRMTLIESFYYEKLMERNHSILELVMKSMRSIPTIYFIYPDDSRSMTANFFPWDNSLREYRLHLLCEWSDRPTLCGEVGLGYQVSLSLSWIKQTQLFLMKGLNKLKEGSGYLAAVLLSMNPKLQPFIEFGISNMLSELQEALKDESDEEKKPSPSASEKTVDGGIIAKDELTAASISFADHVAKATPSDKFAYEGMALFYKKYDPGLNYTGLEYAEDKRKKKSWIWATKAALNQFKSTSGQYSLPINSIIDNEIKRFMEEKKGSRLISRVFVGSSKNKANRMHYHVKHKHVAFDCVILVSCLAIKNLQSKSKEGLYPYLVINLSYPRKGIVSDSIETESVRCLGHATWPSTHLAFDSERALLANTMINISVYRKQSVGVPILKGSISVCLNDLATSPIMDWIPMSVKSASSARSEVAPEIHMRVELMK